MVEGGGNFDARVAALRGRGFTVESPTGDHASEQMLRLESGAEHASNVRARVLTLPSPHQERRDDFLVRLADPHEAEAVEIELNSLLRQHRPWVIVADRARIGWSDEGRSVELSRLLDRLDQLDDSLVLAAPRITNLIEAVAPWREILPVLEELEARNSRRIGALDGMMEMLAARGWDVSRLEVGALHERFAAAEKLHGMDAALARCQRQIESEIRPFGDDIAERLWEATVISQRVASAEAVHAIEEEIKGEARELSLRLAQVEERIARWQLEGFEVPATLPLLAGEMILWEHRLPELADQVEATHGLWAQIEPHLAQWPEYRRLAERTRGHLGAIDALEVLLQGLSSKTEGARAACNSRLEVWGAAGIDTSVWAPLIDGEPRAVLEELDGHQQLIDLILPTIAALDEIDVSLRGADDAAVWLSRLRRKGAGVGDVEDTQDWLELATLRNERHRGHLDQARRELATLWPADVDPSSLDLAEYEGAISGLESGVGMPSPHRIEIRDESRLNRVTVGLEREFESWAGLGWSIEGLRELLVQDPVRLGLDLPAIRAAVDAHEARLARLEPLPWALDVSLAERVLADISRPERLPSLDSEIPDLMRTLSSGKGHADPDFTFDPFRPHDPRAHIEARRPVLTPEVMEEPLAEVGVAEPDHVLIPEPETESDIKIKDSNEDIVDIPATADWLADTVAKPPPPTSGPPQKADVDWLASDDSEEDAFSSMISQASSSDSRKKPKPPRVEVVVPKKAEKRPEKKVEKGGSTESERVRSLLGLGSEDTTINELIFAPLDVRVQRLVRLAQLIDEGGSDDHDALFNRLIPLSKKLEGWTRERLSRRHASSGQGLLLDAIGLGERLAEIPGPGTPIPLEQDHLPLPDAEDLGGLQAAVSRLEGAVRLPSARIQTVEVEG